MNKATTTINAPAPIGPYNQAIQAGNTLYISGQIALHPETNELVTSDISEETKQVLDNLTAILEAATYRLEDVVKTTIFIADMNDFAAINAVYATYFDGDLAPARECVAVKTLPKNVNVEISAIAYR